MIIGQMSDFHVAPPGSATDARFRTAEHLERCVAHVNALPVRPDVMLLTGDLVQDGTAAEYARLKELLRPLEMPLYLIPGNHDDRDALRAAFAEHDYWPDGPFLHYTVERHAVRLVALDTVLPGKSRGQLCPERLAWLEARLGEAPDRPTLIFMHHPPFVTGLRGMDRSRLVESAELGAIVARHPQVERIVCGHVHRPIQRRWHGTMVSVCPSTAHALALDLGEEDRLAVIMEPPACQLHVWLPEEGLVTHTSYVGYAGAEPLYQE